MQKMIPGAIFCLYKSNNPSTSLHPCRIAMVDENKNAKVGAWIFEESSENPDNDHGGDFDAKTTTGSPVTLTDPR
jgi:hypothetical protein